MPVRQIGRPAGPCLGSLLEILLDPWAPAGRKQAGPRPGSLSLDPDWDPGPGSGAVIELCLPGYEDLSVATAS